MVAYVSGIFCKHYALPETQCLSAHGLIPEGVAVVTSVTTHRGHEVATPLGMFSYAHLPVPLYGVDVRMRKGGSMSVVDQMPARM